MNMTEKKRSYDAGFKLTVIDMAKKTNSCAAARKYGVTEKMVRDWRRNEDALKTIPRSKCAMRSGAPFWPELENYLEGWLTQQRQNGNAVTRGSLKAQAIRWAKLNEPLCRDFKATSGLCSRFMKRKDLVNAAKNENGAEATRRLKRQSVRFSAVVIHVSSY
ncbi:hypothetical protein M514_20376 [Trichuris suis]|uniref:HTH CENPB-type domain-containing protein n=1 Tax=Trichuris suis TaxID=68888 RepID=A0A085NCZ4_9BILA|nr:hypothetical protein M514_23117 [Trichuris suis]KFD67340.1 hypothetical protein M514_20376 [Trichuris suis]